MNLGHLGLVLQQSVSLGCEYIFQKVSLLNPLNLVQVFPRLALYFSSLSSHSYPFYFVVVIDIKIWNC